MTDTSVTGTPVTDTSVTGTSVTGPAPPPTAPSGPGGRRLRRHQAVAGLLALYEQPRYLEVGVCRGVTFHALEAPYKVAVDPLFQFDVDAATRSNPHARYHQVTSDEYFGTLVGEDETFDVVYLDGLHTFEQTLRDLENALRHLQPRGVILIDDVRPVSFLASLPDKATFTKVRNRTGETNRAWMGDVYKLLWFVDSFHQQLSYRTIRDNHGQAVLWRQRRPSVTERSVSQIAAMSFEDMVVQREVLRLARYADIVEEVRTGLRL